MAFWLFKEEPSHYSLEDFERDGSTDWDGVGNNLARKNLRNVKRGDQIFFYHTGKEKAVVGVLAATSDAQTGEEHPQSVLVNVKWVCRLPHPVSLVRIKEDPLLAEWDLVRLPRLSVVPVSKAQWRRVEQLSRNEGLST